MMEDGGREAGGVNSEAQVPAKCLRRAAVREGGQRDGKEHPQEGPSTLPGPGTGSSGGLRAAAGTLMWTPCLRPTDN